MLSIITSQRAKKKELSDRHHSFVQHKNIADDIIQYLNNNMGEPLKLQDIAEQFAYSLSSIKRIFKKETGRSIIDYHNNIRIVEAKRLLKDSSTSIQEISDSLGFVNAGYFARSFKKREGISPSAYRKTVKKQGADAVCCLRIMEELCEDSTVLLTRSVRTYSKKLPSWPMRAAI
jgi:AraC-like DNA-binding protein